MKSTGSNPPSNSCGRKMQYYLPLFSRHTFLPLLLFFLSHSCNFPRGYPTKHFTILDPGNSSFCVCQVVHGPGIWSSRPTHSQFWSFKIRRTTILDCIKFPGLLNFWKGLSGSLLSNIRSRAESFFFPLRPLHEIRCSKILPKTRNCNCKPDGIIRDFSTT